MHHIKRSCKVSPNVTFESDTKFVKPQDEFLDNQNDKAHFIAGSSNHLSQNSFAGYQCVADADTAIARVALEYHSSGKYIVVNADDFDVLCLLMHHLDTTETFVGSRTSYRLFIHSFRT